MKTTLTTPGTITKITRATLIKELGHNLATSVLSRRKRNNTLLIPNIELLHSGDIILSSDSHKKSAVQLAQQNLANKRGYTEKDWIWTHAMMYVNNIHVAESNIYMNWSDLVVRGGLQVVPLTSYSNGKLVICRHRRAEHGVGKDAALYAMGNCVVSKRKYPWRRIIISALTATPARKVLHAETTCSEFALECLAIGAACMVKEYNEVQDGIADYYPADFHASGEFAKIPMTYFELVD